MIVIRNVLSIAMTRPFCFIPVVKLKWNYGKVNISPRKLPQCIYPSGPSPHTKGVHTPLQVVQLFLTNVILDCSANKFICITKRCGIEIISRTQYCVYRRFMIIGLIIMFSPTPWFPSIMLRDHFISIMHLEDSVRKLY